MIKRLLLIGMMCSSAVYAQQSPAEITNNIVNVMRVLKAKDDTAQLRIKDLENELKKLSSLEPSLHLSQTIKAIRELNAQSIERLVQLEAKLVSLEQAGTSKESLQEVTKRVVQLEQYISRMENEAGNVLKVI